MAQSAGISGRALGLATAGGILVYAGLRGESPLESLRGILTGSPAPVPKGTPVELVLPSAGSGGSGTLGVEPGSSAIASKAASIALRQVGKPYRWGASGPDRFDCSGLISYAYRQAGSNIGRLTSWGFMISPRFKKISRGQVKAGDVLWKPGHVALAISSSALVEAPRTGIPVRTRAITGFSAYLRYAPGNLGSEKLAERGL
jgi:cell wall-associated NlpC family hydrolase